MELRASKARTRFQALTVAAVLGLGVVGGTATMSARADPAPTSATAPAGVTDPTAVSPAFIEAWNAQRWDDIRAFITDDMVQILPNQEPVKGATAVMDLYRKLRPLLGEIAPGIEIHKAVRTKDTYSRSISFATKSGVRLNDAEIIVRQADGTWRISIAQTGMRDPLP